MFEILSVFFQKKHIELFGAIPLSSCKIVKPYLLERESITDGTVFVFAVPYLTKDALAQDRNISAYAISKDYHLFFSTLFWEILPSLQVAYPMQRFRGFADHSPIDEVHAAASAGLGVIGKNRLLITEKYSSYVFLGEIITDAKLDVFAKEILFCRGCGQCIKACPAKGAGMECLSALTQKKGELSKAEENHIINNQTAWGCDLCQEVCPYTCKAIQNGTIFSPIPFFHQSPLPHLTLQMIEEMCDSDFSERAYAWRKKETILRNLRILEKVDKKGD